MAVWRQEVLLVFWVAVVGFFSLSAHGQFPRSQSDKVTAVQNIPATNFTCEKRTPGYYADVETGCQVYHMCTEGGQQFSYRCPNTTLFQQRMLICAHWYQVNCSRSERDYTANLLIGQRDKPFVDESEHISIYFNNDKDFHPLRNPEDLQRLGTHGNGGGRVSNVQFMPNRAPSLVEAPQQSLTSRQFETTRPVNTQFRPFLTSSNPVTPQTFHTRPEVPQPLPSTGNNFQQFAPSTTTQVTTTSFPKTETAEPNYDTTTTDYYDEDISNSYNNFINRFIPNLNETNRTSEGVANTASTQTYNTERITTLVPHPTKPSITEAIFKTGANAEEDANNNKANTNLYNNFISRFVPFVNETEDSKTEQVPEVHKFLKRFNPDEVVPNANADLANNHYKEESAPSITDYSFGNDQNLVTSHSLLPPPPAPSFNLELPQYNDDAVHMESNLLQLRFPDPRHVFFIPDNDKENDALRNESPITVSIPRQHPKQLLHPMLFVNSISDCSKCHPFFIVDSVNCSPCVAIR